MVIWYSLCSFGTVYVHLVQFVFIWYSLCSFGIVCVHLVHFSGFWYHVSRQIWQPCSADPVTEQPRRPKRVGDGHGRGRQRIQEPEFHQGEGGHGQTSPCITSPLGANFDPRGEVVPQGVNLSSRGEVIPWG
jgi:hypothetical protein